MSGEAVGVGKTLGIADTARAGPRWAKFYLPASAADDLINAVWFFTLAWQASRFGWAGGLVLAVGMLPGLALTFWGGALSDRLGAHKITMWTMAGRLALLAAWAGTIIFHANTVLVVIVSALLMEIVGGIHDPAVNSLPQWLLPTEGIETGVNVQRIFRRLADTVGPAVGGVLAGFVGMGRTVLVALLVGVVPLIAFAWLARTIRPRATDPTPVADHRSADEGRTAAILAGVRWVVRHPVVRKTLLVQAMVNLTSTSVLMVLLPFQTRLHHWSSWVFGAASAASFAGVLVGVLLAFKIRARFPAARVAIAVSAAGIGFIFVASIGFAGTPFLVILATGCMGLANGPVGATLTGWTQAQVDKSNPRTFGRVTAAFLLVTGVAMPLGYLVCSVILGVGAPVWSPSLFVGAVGLAVVVWTLSSRRVLSAGRGV